MSGTSADAIDAALVEFSPAPRLLGSLSTPLPDGLRADILALCAPGVDEIDRMGVLDRRLGDAFADAVLALLQQQALPPTAVTAIGSHGQTVRHRPGGSHAFTLQIGDANTIAERTGITVVADFRRRDVAAGGQGAPLVPAFHQAAFSHAAEARAIVNLGGMANVSLLPPGGTGATGFDTGPGNVLLDGWIDHQRGLRYDRNGDWARTGRVRNDLLARLLSHPFLTLPPPKSTGREDFHLAWLLEQLAPEMPPEDVQATLVEFTARSVAEAVITAMPGVEAVYLCGGGAYNGYLRERLAMHLPAGCRLEDTSALGVAPAWVEAVAFAWLARETLAGRPGNLPAVTGARRAVPLGAIYPA